MLDVRDGTALITLSGPARNALDEAMVAAISAAFDAAEADESVRCVVLTGAGPAFCSGAVLSTLIDSAEGRFDDVVAVYEGFLRVRRSPLPTIAAVNGPAVGAGLNLALACDVRVASTQALFESRFPVLRLHPGGGHTWLLTRAIGRQRATMMSLFGEVLDAEVALGAGLVAAVHSPETLLEEAMTLARRVEDLERDFVENLTSTLRAAEESPDHEGVLALETQRQRWSTTRPAFLSATRALQARIAGRAGAAR
ncbi:enoyl-CoA hydratase-related protein [Naasia aerilata]|uniref:enoyl-CoA hydratase-related protein n=1 Tax=Naasia aerilata TaxID=1162966 RepID=UPI0025747695|nr:enoyl-CoA hydratase-related protein [Naasia aerilata]